MSKDSKLVFKIVALIGTILILLGILLPAWNMNIKMGANIPTAKYRIFEQINIIRDTNGENIFPSFNDAFANVVETIAYVLAGTAFLLTVTCYIDNTIKGANKIFNGVKIFFGTIVCICVISIFVFAILFVKQNDLVKIIGLNTRYTMKPSMENGLYFIIMGGFINGIAGIYTIKK